MPQLNLTITGYYLDGITPAPDGGDSATVDFKLSRPLDDFEWAMQAQMVHRFTFRPGNLRVTARIALANFERQVEAFNSDLAQIEQAGERERERHDRIVEKVKDGLATSFPYES